MRVVCECGYNRDTYPEEERVFCPHCRVNLLPEKPKEKETKEERLDRQATEFLKRMAVVI